MSESVKLDAHEFGVWWGPDLSSMLASWVLNPLEGRAASNLMAEEQEATPPRSPHSEILSFDIMSQHFSFNG